MKNQGLILAIGLLIAGCGGSAYQEIDPETIGQTAELLDPALKFTLMNTVYLEDLNEQITCQETLSNQPFTKITTLEEYQTLIENSGCEAASFPEIDFKYYFLVFGGALSDGRYSPNPQAITNDGSLALYNIPTSFENKTYIAEPFSGWLMIGRDYIELPLKSFSGETIEF